MKVLLLVVVVALLSSCETELQKEGRRELKEAEETLKRLNFQMDSLDKATELRHRRNELNY